MWKKGSGAETEMLSLVCASMRYSQCGLDGWGVGESTAGTAALRIVEEPPRRRRYGLLMACAGGL